MSADYFLYTSGGYHLTRNMNATNAALYERSPVKAARPVVRVCKVQVNNATFITDLSDHMDIFVESVYRAWVSGVRWIYDH